MPYSVDIEAQEGLFLSAANGYTDILMFFIENGADINACTADHNCTPLMLAIENGHTNTVNVLIQYGANVALTDDSGFTALHYACIDHGSLEILGCLIQKGADVNTGSNDKLTPLMIAAEKGHINALTLLIKFGADVDLQDKNGKTALHHAVYGSDVSCEILSCLIEMGADVSAGGNINHTPLMIAAEKGHINAVTFLIRNGADVDLQDQNYGETALFCAVRGFDASCEVLNCLTKNGADINASSKRMLTPLMIAAKMGCINAVTFLMECGAIVDLQDKDGKTALHYAVHALHHACRFHGSCEILSCLIETGADVNARAKNKSTPLMMACEYGHLNAVTFLTEHGAHAGLRDEDDKTALHYAVCGSDVSCEILSYLIGIGADVNACAKNKGTPLMIAAENGHINAVTTLVKCGAYVDLKDKDGQTALHYALMYSPHASIEVLNCLIKNEADVNAFTFRYETPLMLASYFETSVHDHVKAVTFLIEHGANVDLQDNNGDTALHYAVTFDFPEIVKMLLNLGASDMCNNKGLTPLHQASISASIGVVEYLIKRPEITKEQRVDALELLGASRATQYKEFSLLSFFVAEGLMYIKRGMEERFVDPSQPILTQPKKPAYGNRKDSQTPEELAQIEGDTEAILMESLLIKERILGTNHSELLRSIRFVCSSCNLTDPSLLIALYSRAVDIAQKSNLSSLDDFQEISHLLHKICSGSNHLKEKDLLELLRQIVIEYEKQHTKRRRNDNKQYCQQLVREDLFDCSLELVLMISKSEFCDERNASSLTMLLRKLFMQDPRNRSGNTLLHEFIERCTDDDDDLFPCRQAVNLLLNEGFNNYFIVINNEGNTPLHIAVMLEPRNDKLYLVTEILQLLFYGGAHHDFVNNDGKTPMDMAKTDEARMILSERRKLELKCISAKAVKKFGIPYLGVVPKTLENYISRH
ncbi:unnamed protein product [Porites lobata]|uniref:Ankyrin repeat protein n=1 Tax=Porites lobata TaxID=104759 RepID=A0ABN8PTX7_9CNID|nr:unnamed protein product [Porites lobata]